MATTTITIFHDPAYSDGTVVDLMRPNGIPQDGDPADYEFTARQEYANKMVKFFASLAGSHNASVNTFVMSTSTATISSLIVTDNPSLVAGNTFSIGTVTFTATAGAPVARTEFQIGATAADTVTNIVATLQAVVADGDFGGAITSYADATEVVVLCYLGAIGSIIPTTVGTGVTGMEWTASSFETRETTAIAMASSRNTNNYGYNPTTIPEAIAPTVYEYLSSYSPLAYGGDNYTTDMVFVSRQNDQTSVAADNTVIVGIPDGTTVRNYHAVLFTAAEGGPTLYFTAMIDEAVFADEAEPETLAGAQNIVNNFLGLATGNAINFKADYLTIGALGDDYTWSGLSGFEVAGAVTVAAGGTSPVTLVGQVV